ncbi:YdeI/OmpD-associated family protein [Galbibacter pacificus]|uniref:DUF1801 domain-containing protein n=1 Tax=Galbibacter pacificus TaxID=2996052 RepID=A0ABT6FV48_9FLAO|nr:DUF1801 domain-containing protein [Galbibacter pacificus]MDG3583380.1 DUF1801 domain-containing protein [Galbibacter pacificus]MDG3587143.1 DUF1801 domain-containing protein [Galbibacter pacificus]
MKPKNVDEYIQKHLQWENELMLLRSIINETELEENIKWGAPTYTVNNKNVVGIGAFKAYAGLWFFNGALLKDEAKMLINAQEGKTVAMRQWRFNTIDEIRPKLVKSYIEEAIENQKEGREVSIAKKQKNIISDELSVMLKNDAALKNSFDVFTKAKQNEFHEYINEAKRKATKQNRLQKIIPMIKSGEGLYDRYKK